MFDSRAFRTVLSAYATGVTVATAGMPDGARVGLTINSFTSVSLDPPLVLFCLDKHSSALPIFTESLGFTVNVLRANQAEISQGFAKRGQGDERWQDLSLTSGQINAAPILEDSLAWLECVHHAQYDGGDHLILVGRVVNMARSEGNPLLYWNSGYQYFSENQ